MEKLKSMKKNMLDKLLDKIKEIIGIKKLYDTKILVKTDDKLQDITFKML